MTWSRVSPIQKKHWAQVYCMRWSSRTAESMYYYCIGIYIAMFRYTSFSIERQTPPHSIVCVNTELDRRGLRVTLVNLFIACDHLASRVIYCIGEGGSFHLYLCMCVYMFVLWSRYSGHVNLWVICNYEVLENYLTFYYSIIHEYYLRVKSLHLDMYNYTFAVMQWSTSSWLKVIDCIQN